MAIVFKLQLIKIQNENIKEAIDQLSYELQVCNFSMLLLSQNNILKQNSLNVIVFKLQLI